MHAGRGRGADPRAIRAAIDRLDLTGTPLYASEQNSSSGRATPKTTSTHAVALWRGARPVAGTLAETYLRERGFDEPPPATIRFCLAIAMNCAENITLGSFIG